MFVCVFVLFFHLVHADTISNDTISHQSNNKLLFESFRDIFNILNLDRTSFRNDVTISSQCRSQLDQFFVAIKSQQIWALEMMDANGQSSPSWFLGQKYWTGSKFQCNNLPKLHYGNQNGTLIPQTEFTILKLLLNSNFYHIINRLIFWGLCLPKSCTKTDVSQLFYTMMEKLNATMSTTELIDVHLVQIKQNEHYNFMNDPIFYYSTLIFLSVLGISVIGTIYDNHIEKMAKISKVCYITEDRPKSQLYGDKKDTILMKVVLSFSLRSNLKSITQHEIGADTIPVLHGLRFLSMCWIIASHTCLVSSKYSDNPKFQRLIKDELITKTILNGAYNVDTFFFISGLLVTLLYLRNDKRGKISSVYRTQNEFFESVFHFFGLIIYRFVRLTVPYAYIILIQNVAAKWFYYNSVFDPPYLDHETCTSYWWRNIFYINTFYPVEQMCMIWSWYLANDTQFYVLGAIILVLYKNNMKKLFEKSYAAISASMFFMFLITSWLITGYVSYINEFIPHYENALRLFDELYDKPYTRLGPYFIGMLTGWILFKTDCKIVLSKLTVIFGWFLTTILIYSLLYEFDDVNKSAFSGACYSCLSHTAWAIGMLWIVVACTGNYGGYLTSILSSKNIRPLSRLTYCAYLVHPIVIRSTVMTLDKPLNLSRFLIGIIFIGQLTVSFVLALMLSLLFEAPIISILRLLAGRKSK